MENRYKKAYIIVRNKQEWLITSDHPMYCCHLWVNGWINDPRLPASYNPWRRCYYFMVPKNTGWMQQVMKCIYCDKKFPEDLTDIREEILAQEYGINEFPMEVTNKKFSELGILDEFFTEQWWRKRGL